MALALARRLMLGLLVVIAAMPVVAQPRPVIAADPSPSGSAAWMDPIDSAVDHITRLVDSARMPTPPSPTAPGEAPASSQGSTRTSPSTARPFSMNLYQKGDFVSQQTEYWCVAASVQTMMNIIDDGRPDRTRKRQQRLHFQGRRLDRTGDRYWRKVAGESRWSQGLHGLGIQDWAGVLEARGYGPYDVERAPSLKRAIRMAAKAIRATGKPAGLVVWRGAHAWVMSGFVATADPAISDDFTVLKVFIQDPWYPRVSSFWGASRPPDSAVTPRQLRSDFLRYNRPGRRHPMRDGKYMLILPGLTPHEADPATLAYSPAGSSFSDAELMQ
jgi:hypothetical protein